MGHFTSYFIYLFIFIENALSKSGEDFLLEMAESAVFFMMLLMVEGRDCRFLII